MELNETGWKLGIFEKCFKNVEEFEWIMDMTIRMNNGRLTHIISGYMRATLDEFG